MFSLINKNKGQGVPCKTSTLTKHVLTYQYYTFKKKDKYILCVRTKINEYFLKSRQYSAGKMHYNGGPAFIMEYGVDNRYGGEVEWWEHGEICRTGGYPARCWFNGKESYKAWFCKGKMCHMIYNK